ncbi:MAG: oligosaccharide flippase family protein [Bacteroidales bacterium]|nr:oligosaccharide flippase family protein [Bacteroidales bacterium]
MHALKKAKELLKKREVLSLFGSGAVSVFGLLNFMLLARLLSPSDFGEWQIYISAGVFIEMIRFGITETATVKFLSGAVGEERKYIVGANFRIGLTLAFFSSLIIILLNLVFRSSLADSAFNVFFKWYPIALLVGFPFRNSFAILQANLRFDSILVLRLLNGITFLLLLVFLFVADIKTSIEAIAVFHIFLMLLCSAFSIYMKWDGIRYFKYYDKKHVKRIIDFGKYSSLTMLGSNLLRNTDTWIISLSPLGTAAVAVYSIPLKLIDIFQIPLRSISTTAFPVMSKAFIQKDFATLRYVFHSRIGFLTLLYFPFIVFALLFPGFLITILAGESYLLSGYNSILVFRFLTIYALLMPFDKFTGVALDAVNKPSLNTIKVIIMVITNLTGDIIALWVYQSLPLVAFASIIFTSIGSVYGYYYVRKELDISFIRIFKVGYGMFRDKVLLIIGLFRSKMQT